MISGSTKFGSSVVSGFCFCHLLSLYLQSVVGLSKLQLNSAWIWHETNHKLTYNTFNDSLCSSRNRSTHDKNLVCIHCRIVSMCNAVSNSQHGQIQLPAEAKATNSATKGPPWITLKLVLVRPRNLCIVPLVNVQFSRYTETLNISAPVPVLLPSHSTSSHSYYSEWLSAIQLVFINVQFYDNPDNSNAIHNSNSTRNSTRSPSFAVLQMIYPPSLWNTIQSQWLIGVNTLSDYRPFCENEKRLFNSVDFVCISFRASTLW